MHSWRNLFGSIFLFAFAVSVAGCDDTWRGIKRDTGENLEKTGEALDKAGEKVKGEDE